LSGTNHRIDGGRLWDSLMRMAEIGATPRGGVRRLALSAEDARGRERFKHWCESLGLAVRVDAMGNMFARREGRDPRRAPVLFGSHLDSQPSGGKFDGALGVLAGLEVMRSLRDLDIATEAPLELVNWTDEEGSRFGRSLMGSGVWAGVYPEGEILAARDTEASRSARRWTASARAARTRGALPRPTPTSSSTSSKAPSSNGRKIVGVVTGAQAQVWWDARVTGQDSHAGTTPPSARRDALVCAARVVDLVDRMMRARGEDGRGTVGFLQVQPNSRNVVPGEARFSVEFRHPDTARWSGSRRSSRARPAPSRATAAFRSNWPSCSASHTSPSTPPASLSSGKRRPGSACRRATSSAAPATTRCTSPAACPPP
jgi:N-carbamoyl-L-amino-acid hydrolase